MQTTLAITLRIRPFREYDRMITLYTKDYGKLVVVGRGMQKVRSKLAGHLREGMLSSVTFVHGKRFDTITAAQIEQSFPTIRNNLQRLAVASALLEHYDRWMKEDFTDLPAWELLVDSLMALEAGVPPMVVRWAFPLRSLSLLGWHLRFDDDRGAGKIEVGNQKWEVTPEQRSALMTLQQQPYQEIPIRVLQSRTIQNIIRSYLLFHREWDSKVERWGQWAFTQ